MPVFTSSIEVTADYPTIKPSLNLNFARARALDPRITFTRASVGTYVDKNGLIKTAGVNEPRFDHDPVTLESLGLLLEEDRTNYCGNSEMLANWGFGVGGDAFSASSGSQLSSNPDGSSPAYYYIPTSAGGYHRFNRGVTLPTLDTNYVVSLFVKRVTAGTPSNLNRYVELEATGLWNGNTPGTGQTGTIGGTSVTFDMQDLVIESVTDNVNGYVGGAKIENYGNGWYRLSYVFNPGIGSNLSGTVWWGHPATLGSDAGNEAGNGSPSFYFWGASVVKGSFITSHIPTPANSSVTRQSDLGKIIGENFSSFFNASEGTFDVGYKLGGDNSSMRVAQVSNGTSNNVIDLVVGSGGGQGGYWFINTGGTTQFSSTSVTNSSQVDRNFRAVLAYKENDCAAQSNKITAGPTIDTSVTLITDYDQLLFYGQSLGNQIQGHLKFIRYYPKRLTNAQVTLFSQD